MLGTEHTKVKKHYLCLQKTSNHEQWQALWHSDLRRYTPDWNPTRLEGLSPGCFTSDPAACQCVSFTLFQNPTFAVCYAKILATG